MRIACDLADLWRRQGENGKALRLLEEVYDQFTEGFDSADLRHVKHLIRELTGGLRKKPSRHLSKPRTPNRRPPREVVIGSSRS